MNITLLYLWPTTQSNVHNNSTYVTKLLIACGVQDDPEIGDSEMSFGADDYGDYIINTLSRLGKSPENLLFLIGDNCAVNQSLATHSTCWLCVTQIESWY